MNRYYPSFGNDILYKYIFYYFNIILHYKFKRLYYVLNTKIYYIPQCCACAAVSTISVSIMFLQKVHHVFEYPVWIV